MLTMQDIAVRSQEIKERLDQILVELRNTENPQELASQLAEEIALLIREQSIIQHNLKHHEAMTEHLLNCKCSGPH
jgi:hypothetical protein